MNDGIVIAVASFAVSGLIAFGIHKATSQEHERRISAMEENQDKIFDRLNALGETFVSYRHFNEVMVTVREAQQELRADVKRVLEIVSRHNS